MYKCTIEKNINNKSQVSEHPWAHLGTPLKSRQCDFHICVGVNCQQVEKKHEHSSNAAWWQQQSLHLLGFA